MDNRDILIWLSHIKGMGNKTIEKLEGHFGSLNEVWDGIKNGIHGLNFISESIKSEMVKTRSMGYIDSIKERLDRLEIKVITLYDREYPQVLRHIYDPPKIFYLKGNLEERDRISIGIVGSRKATAYGKWAADYFARELSSMGITLVSGMARGIDTQVHRGAIEAHGRTIAVLGNGLDTIYPKSNKDLFYEIINSGAVVSEFPLGMEPLPQNFPQRNRIISGLSLGIAVIEAKEKSGSLITAHHALEQGREVFALPGNINSVYSRGTNLLIKDGAKSLTNIEDILDEIKEIKALNKREIKNIINYDSLGEEEIQILKYLQEGPLHSDVLSIRTQMSISKINSIITILEMKGLVKRLSGSVFTL